MKRSMIVFFVVLLCIMLFALGYIFLSDEAKAMFIFFGGIAVLIIISGFLIAIGIKAIFHK